MKTQRGMLWTVWTVVQLSAAVVGAAPSYRAVVVGNLEGHFVLALNAKAQLAGQMYVPTGDDYGYHAFLDSGDTELDLGTLGGRDSLAYGVNGKAQVVGKSETAQGVSHAFLWTRSQGMRDLGTLGDASFFSEAHAINAWGHIVGYGTAPDGRLRAWVWGHGPLQVLPDLGGPVTWAMGINNHGQIVGAGQDLQGAEHILVWPTPTQVIDLGLGYGWGIDDLGIIACAAYVADGRLHACRWNPTDGFEILQDLPGYTSCEALAIDPTGILVGTCTPPPPQGMTQPHAASWNQQGEVVDLTSLVDNRDDFTQEDLFVLDEAFAINARGIILASGWNGGASRVDFLLVPSTLM